MRNIARYAIRVADSGNLTLIEGEQNCNSSQEEAIVSKYTATPNGANSIFIGRTQQVPHNQRNPNAMDVDRTRTRGGIEPVTTAEKKDISRRNVQNRASLGKYTLPRTDTNEEKQ